MKVLCLCVRYKKWVGIYISHKTPLCVSKKDVASCSRSFSSTPQTKWRRICYRFRKAVIGLFQPLFEAPASYKIEGFLCDFLGGTWRRQKLYLKL